jgi:hypothetical protein
MRVSTVDINRLTLFEIETKARNDKVRSGIAHRLRNACSYLTDADFLVLVDKIATVQLVAERAWAAKNLVPA